MKAPGTWLEAQYCGHHKKEKPLGTSKVLAQFFGLNLQRYCMHIKAIKAKHQEKSGFEEDYVLKADLDPFNK